MNKAKFKEGDLVYYTYMGNPTHYTGIISNVAYNAHSWYYDICDGTDEATRRENKIWLVREFDLTGLLAI